MGQLSSLLKNERDAIMAAWLERVGELPEAQGIPEPVLRDNLPQIIDEIAECMNQWAHCRPGLDALPSLHAIDRYKIGFDIRGVIAEYRILRQVILEQVRSITPDPIALGFLHDLLDRAIADAVDHFAFERDRAREIFVGILGHDLRSPLNAISMAAQQLLMHADRLDPNHRRLASRILRSVSRIERMATDLLDFTRGRIGGGVPLTVGTADLGAVIRDVVDEFVEAFPDRTVEAHTGGGDLTGEWDADRLAQLVSNLIANALEHGADPIEVVGGVEGDHHVVIEVRNQGEISREWMPRVFDPFVSLGASRSGRRGLGLGLYIVREIVTAHHGTIDANSDHGSTVFRVSLPRRQPQ